MVGDCKAMRLVAEPRADEERLGIARQKKVLAPVVEDDLLLSLGKAYRPPHAHASPLRGLSLTAPGGGCRPPLGGHAAGGLCPHVRASRAARVCHSLFHVAAKAASDSGGQSCALAFRLRPPRGLPPAFGRPCGGRFVPPTFVPARFAVCHSLFHVAAKAAPTPAAKAALCLSASVPYGGDAACRGAIHCALMGYIQGRGMKRGTMDAPQPVDALPPSPPAAAPPRRRPLGRLPATAGEAVLRLSASALPRRGRLTSGPLSEGAVTK